MNQLSGALFDFGAQTMRMQEAAARVQQDGLFAPGRLASIAHTGACLESLEPVERRQTYVVRQPGEGVVYDGPPDPLTQDEMDAFEQEQQRREREANEARFGPDGLGPTNHE